MKKLIFFSLCLVTPFFMSCESEEGSEKNSGSYNYQEKGKVDPGTYHYPNQRNPWFGDGCKGRSNSTCVLVVTSLQSPVIDFQVF